MKIATAFLTADSPLVETVLGWHWHEWSADHNDADLDTWRDQLRARTHSDHVPFTLVADVDGEPVGCLTVCDDDADPRYVDRGPWLSGMLVVGAARNLGVGRRLLADAEGHAQDFGANELWLHTGQAAQFYERCGYALVHRKQTIEDHAALSRSL